MSRADAGRCANLWRVRVGGWLAWLLSALAAGTSLSQDAGGSISQVEKVKYLTLHRLDGAIQEKKSIDELMEVLHGIDRSGAAAPLLLQEIQNLDDAYVGSLIRKLQEIYPFDDETINFLIRRDKSESDGALARRGTAIFPYLRDALQRRTIAEERALSLLTMMAEYRFPDLDYAEFVPLAVRLLSSADGSRHLLAVRALRAFGPPAHVAVPELVRALQDADRRVVREVIEVLGRFGAPASVAIPALMQLPPKHQELRYAVIDALGRMGPAAVAPLKEFLADPDETIRDAAAQALGGLGPEAKDAVADLQQLLTISNSRSGVLVAMAIWRITGDETPLKPAFDVALEKDLLTVGEQLPLLGSLGGDIARRAAIKSGDPGFRLNFRFFMEVAIGSVGPVAAPAIPELMKLRIDRTEGASVVCFALGNIGPPAVPALIDCLKSSDFEVQNEAMLALAKIGRWAEAAVPDLLRLARQEDGPLQKQALSAVRKILAHKIAQPELPHLLELIERDDIIRDYVELKLKAEGEVVSPGVRQALLARIERRVPELIAQLSNSVSTDRGDAACELIQYGRFAQPAVPQLRRALDDVNRHVRLRAAAALWSSGVPDDRPRQLLIEGLQHPNPETRMETMLLLREIGPPAAPVVGHLLELLTDPMIDVRLDAAHSIAVIDPDQPELVPMLMNVLEDRRCRRNWSELAAEILGTLGRRARSILPRLCRNQSIENSDVIECIIQARWRIEVDCAAEDRGA